MFRHTRGSTVNQADFVPQTCPIFKIFLVKVLCDAEIYGNIKITKFFENFVYKLFPYSAANNIGSINAVETIYSWDEILLIQLLILDIIVALKVVNTLV